MENEWETLRDINNLWVKSAIINSFTYQILLFQLVQKERTHIILCLTVGLDLDLIDVMC